jgi:hypothetical protein
MNKGYKMSDVNISYLGDEELSEKEKIFEEELRRVGGYGTKQIEMFLMRGDDAAIYHLEDYMGNVSSQGFKDKALGSDIYVYLTCYSEAFNDEESTLLVRLNEDGALYADLEISAASYKGSDYKLLIAILMRYLITIPSITTVACDLTGDLSVNEHWDGRERTINELEEDILNRIRELL